MRPMYRYRADRPHCRRRPVVAAGGGDGGGRAGGRSAIEVACRGAVCVGRAAVGAWLPLSSQRDVLRAAQRGAAC